MQIISFTIVAFFIGFAASAILVLPFVAIREAKEFARLGASDVRI